MKPNCSVFGLISWAHWIMGNSCCTWQLMLWHPQPGFVSRFWEPWDGLVEIFFNDVHETIGQIINSSSWYFSRIFTWINHGLTMEEFWGKPIPNLFTAEICQTRCRFSMRAWPMPFGWGAGRSPCFEQLREKAFFFPYNFSSEIAFFWVISFYSDTHAHMYRTKKSVFNLLRFLHV